MKGKRLTIYTDGACLGNPGPGGWGAYLVYADKEKKISGGEAQTTNNRMELTAAIEALSLVKGKPAIRLVTDSTYLKNGITVWIKRWRENGWRTAGRSRVKNRDLWQRLDRLIKTLNVEWDWVRGHTGDHGNETADQLAREAMDALSEQPSPGAP